MLVRPLHDRVVIKRMEEERKTESGIVIPDAATEKPDQGVIVAVGNGKYGDDGKLLPMSVKVGDKVLFGKHARQTFKIEGQEYITMHEEEIIGVIES
ncbi:MAG: co-chaperone GroES [Candidatus Nitrotoga sp.]